MKKNALGRSGSLLISSGACLILLLTLVEQACAQYQFDTWTTEQGLPQNSINDMLQTRDGYLWLATNGGLVRFDGVRFKVFDRSTEGVKTQRINALFEDSKGTLWCGAENAMLIRYYDGRFTTYTVEDGLPFDIVYEMEEDDEGNLWIRWRGEVTRFDGRHFNNYKPADFTHNIQVKLNKANELWWSQDTAGLHYLVKGHVRTYLFQNDLPKIEVTGVSRDQYGNLWIQTKGSGVIKVRNGRQELYTMREGLPDNSVEGRFLQDRKGHLWFADPAGNLYQDKDGRQNLTTASMVRLYEDREGSIWIGTDEGLYRKRNLTISLLTESDGLSFNSIYSIFQDREGTIWIGTWLKGLNKFQNNRITRYSTSEGLLTNHITSIYEDNSGRLLVGTSTGISYFTNGRFKSYKSDFGFLKRHVWTMHQDHAGNFWFGTDQGLVKRVGDHLTNYTSKDGLSHDRIIALFESRAGVLWVGTDHGLTRLKDDVFSAYTEREGFVGYQVRAIYEDGEGVLWIGTYDGGLYRLKNERLTRYTTKEGLYDNGVFQILEDDAGNLWMGCNRGIYRVSRRELNDFAEGRAQSITSTVFGIKDGMSSLECNGGRQPSGLKTADGRLWFPTAGGVAIVDPKAIPFNTVAPNVIIEEFYLDDKAIEFQYGVEIPPNTNSFEIRYTAPSFIKPEQVKFKYKLVGLDKDWIAAGDRRTVHYHRIPPGRYQFVVIAANADGVWNTEGKNLEIVVIPPFWMRWWFVTIVTFAITTIIFWRYKSRVRHLRKEHARQQAFSQQLIESQESERKRIAYELHDSLEQYLLVAKNNALLGADMAERDSAIKEKLDDVTSMTSQALEEVRRISHNLRPSQLDELGLKDALEAMIESVSNSSRIRFTAEIDPIDGTLSKEAEVNLYRIAQESINNILKHSSASEAEVKLKRDGRNVRLTIKDNGKGFISDSYDPADSHHRSFGLSGISERARMLGGKEDIHSVPGQGTTITVTLTLQDTRHEQ